MTAQQRTLFWAAVLGLTVALLWLLSPVLLPFVLGMAVAYLLDPVIGWMTRTGMSRGVAAGGLVLGSYVVNIVVLVLLAPVLLDQATDFAARLPAYAQAAWRLVEPLAQRAAVLTGDSSAADLVQRLGPMAERVVGLLAGLVTGLFARSFALVNVVLLLAITPLVTFYLLRDWPKVVDFVDGILPRAHAETIRAQARAIDHVLSGFARGTAIVCLTLAVFYAVSLSLVGLEFGLVIGFVAGLVSFVPYVGTLIGLSTSVGVALFQFWPSWPRVAVVLGVFIAGQVLQDYVLTPRLVGERVGLHPLWVMFGVLAGGTLFGFAGMLIAVPACAVIGVLTRFTLDRYRSSALYQDPGDHAHPD